MVIVEYDGPSSFKFLGVGNECVGAMPRVQDIQYFDINSDCVFCPVPCLRHCNTDSHMKLIYVLIKVLITKLGAERLYRGSDHEPPTSSDHSNGCIRAMRILPDSCLTGPLWYLQIESLESSRRLGNSPAWFVLRD
jgi:hypothetical protein